MAYKNTKYIADRLFPPVPVQKQSDIIPEYDQSPWFRNTARMRAPGTRSEGGGYTVNTSNKYFCDWYSYRREVADQIRMNADMPFNMDRDAVELVTDKLQMLREVNFATNFFKTGVWGTDKTGGTDFTTWDDYGNSTPLLDIETYRDTMEASIALEPNKIVMGKQVWLQLKWHPDLIDVIKYTQKGIITEDLAASMMSFTPDSFMIGRSIQVASTSPEGTAEASVTYSRIWGKNVLLTYTPDGPSLLTPTAGYCFVWQIVPAALQYIKRMRDEEREVDIFEANSYFHQCQVVKNAGVFLSGAVA